MLLRQTTPFDESNTITRSGRRSIPPLQTWKGERFDLNWDGTINGVRRVEEIEVDKPKRKYSRPKASSRLRSIKEDIDEEEELEEWEAEGDIITGKVQLYDIGTDSTSYELHEEGKQFNHMRRDLAEANPLSRNCTWAELYSHKGCRRRKFQIWQDCQR